MTAADIMGCEKPDYAVQQPFKGNMECLIGSHGMSSTDSVAYMVSKEKTTRMMIIIIISINL